MRLFITTLSLFSVIAFGYALAGYGGTLFGQGARMDYVIFGLAIGFGCALSALWLWYRHRADFFCEADDTAGKAPDAVASNATAQP